MSLRTKIILLFVGLAVVPLLGVAAFASSQAESLASDVVVEVLNGSAARLASELDDATATGEERLDRLASSALTVRHVEGAATRDEWLADHGEGLAGFAYAEIDGIEGGSRVLWGTVPAETVACRAGWSSRLVRWSRRVPGLGPGAVLSVGLWPHDLIQAPAGDVSRRLAVLERDGGSVLLASGCERGVRSSMAVTLSVFTSGGGERGSTFTDPDGVEHFAAARPLSTRPWTVVAAQPVATIISPLKQIQRAHWGFVLTLMLATGLAFSTLLRGVVRSLEELTQAAERIGEGDLNPWLPPPGPDEVGRLSLAFGGMLERLRQMIARVDQEGRLAVVGRLTSYLAHEIRNPLSSIRMNLQTLQRDIRSGRMPSDSRDIVDLSLREVERLATSVNRVLNLGSSQGPVEREEVSVHEVVQEAAHLLRGQLDEAGIAMRLELDASGDRVLASPGQLKGVFLNLFMNAVEAQPDGGEILIRSRLSVAPGQGPRVAVRVRDRGTGVPPDLRERIFQPFFSTKSQGSGIGLAVAQRDLREIGGDLYLADLPETLKVTEFVVELPLAAVVAERVDPPRVNLPQWMSGGTARTWARVPRTRPAQSHANGTRHDE